MPWLGNVEETEISYKHVQPTSEVAYGVFCVVQLGEKLC